MNAYKINIMYCLFNYNIIQIMYKSFNLTFISVIIIISKNNLYVSVGYIYGKNSKK